MINKTGFFMGIILVLFVFTNCQKIGEYYVGLNLQPDMSNSTFDPGLNVFGVLKTGPDFDTINHFFEVQQLISMQHYYDSLSILDAVISLKRTVQNSEVQFFQPQSKGNGQYFDETIVTAPGDSWLYTCTFDTFEVTSECIIPNTPQLAGDITLTGGNQLAFTVQADSTAFMYQLYVLSGENFFLEKRIPQKGFNTVYQVQLPWTVESESALVYLFAYDKNMVEYITTSNTFFKPNAFRPAFSTVEGGYGTFGAISSNLFVVPSSN